MHWKSTLLLVLLAGGVGAWLWKGDEWAVQWGLRPAPEPNVSDSPSVSLLAADVSPTKLTRIEVPMASGSETLVLARANPQAEWTMPGNWPLRRNVVEELVATLTNLQTRFAPIALGTNADLNPYGLASTQSPLAVTVQSDGRSHTLRFGRPNTTGENPFTQPTYLRIDDKPEVLRLGPDVLGLLHRPIEEYRRRQVIPESSRVRLEASRPPVQMPNAPPQLPSVVPILGDAIESVEVIGPSSSISVFGMPLSKQDGRYVLQRTQPTPKASARTAEERSPALSNTQLAEAWETTAPVRHAAEPGHLRTVLTLLPDLWADDFQLPEVRRRVLLREVANLFGTASSFGTLEAAAICSNMTGTFDDWFMKRAGLMNPERRVLVKSAGASGPIELRIGHVAEVRKTGDTGIETRYRYAMLANNPAIFLVKSAAVEDLFARAPSVRDSRLARFTPAEVEELIIENPGKPATKLVKTPGDPKATLDVEKKDRWHLIEGTNSFLADESKVNEVVTLLSALDTPASKQSFSTTPPKGARVTLRTREPRPDGQPKAPMRTHTFRLGGAPILEKKVDGPESKTIQVALEGRPRVDTIDNADDRVTMVIDRPSVAYRSRKLFDTTTAKLASISVKDSNGEAFSLAKAATGDGWTLTQPPAGTTDPAKTTQLTNTLTDLEVEKFLDSAASPEDLAKYGLDKPTLAVALGFQANGKAQPHSLDIGKAVPLTPGTATPEKSQMYARLDGQTVFTIPATVVDSLKSGALSLLPTQVLPGVERFTKIDVQNGAAAYSLTPAGNDWNLNGPFSASVATAATDPAVKALTSLAAEKYEALAASDPKKYGLDAPTLRVAMQFQPKEAGAPPASRTLLVGKATADGGSRYAQLQGGGSGAVFTVAAGALAPLERPALALLDTRLLTLDVGSITQIDFTGAKPDDALSLRRGPQGWVAEGQGFQVDSLAIRNLLGRLANFQVYRIVGYGANTDWARSGLAPPERSIRITLGGPQPAVHTIAFGGKDMTGDRYIRVDEGPRLAIVFAGEAADLTPNKLDFVDRTLLRFNPQSFNGLVRMKGKDELVIEPGTTQGWEITKPAKQKADTVLLEGIEGLEESRGLIRVLSNLQAIKIAAYGSKSELTRFGLDSPAATITLKMLEKPEERILKIGNLVDAAKPEGDRYATVESSGPNVTIGILPAAVCKMLLAEPIYYRDRTLAKFRDADKITLERGDRIITFAKVMGTWKVIEPLRVDAEHNDLEDFVNALANLRADELVKDKADDLVAFGLAKPAAKWKLFNRGKEELSLFVGKSENGRAFAKLEKPDNIVALSPGLTNRVLGEYRKRKIWDGIDATQISSVVISHADRTFQLSKFGQIWEDPKMPGDRIAVPVVNDFLAALRDLSASRYVSDGGADLKLYGLEKPQRVIVLTQTSPMGGTMTRTLRIGAAEGGSDDKRFYAAVDEPGRTEVFVLGEADAARLMRDRTDFLEKK